MILILLSFKISILISILAILISYFFYFFVITNGNENDPLIMWWTPLEIPHNIPVHISCEKSSCFLTNNRNYTEKANAIVFYASDFNEYDLPLPRNNQIWALISEESPKNNQLLLYNETLSLFNISSTFSRYSNFPTTLQYLPSLDDILDTKYLKSVEEKNLLLENGTSPILYLQSSCSTPILRDTYVKELMKYIPIDSYGKCLNNKPLPKSAHSNENNSNVRFAFWIWNPPNENFSQILRDNYLNSFYSTEVLQFMSKYKFVIAIENAECEDYITEKLWKPLVAGTIPIYKGSPTVRDWLPNPKSAILFDDFPNIEYLAKFILKINSNDSLYKEYFQHKTKQLISNSYLTETVKEQKDQNQFNCFICDVLTRQRLQSNILVVSTQHYSCSYPRNEEKNYWSFFWEQGKCRALIVHEFVKKNQNYTYFDFQNAYDEYMETDKCFFYPEYKKTREIEIRFRILDIKNPN